MGDLSEHFDRSEFACKCGCGFDTVDAELLEALELIRQHFDRPIVVNSACRCPAHNVAVGGGRNSQHLLGRAADILVHHTDPAIVAELARQMGIGGVGDYESFTHIDTRSGTARWSG